MKSSIIALAAMLVLFSGCTKKAEGQTVAVVNGEEITTAELNSELSNTQLPAGLDKDQARSRALKQIVDRTLLAQEARKEGIDKSPDYLEQSRRLNQDLLVNLLAQRQSGTSDLPSDTEVAKFEADNPQIFAKREIWNLDQLRFPTPPAGPLAQQIGKTKSLGELANLLSANHITMSPAKNRIDTSVVPQKMYAQISGLAPGEPFIVPVGDQEVASAITERDPAPLVGDSAKPIAVAALRKQQTFKALHDRLDALRKTAKIEYKSGFGPAK